jgi:hypothetical protein
MSAVEIRITSESSGWRVAFAVLRLVLCVASLGVCVFIVRALAAKVQRLRSNAAYRGRYQSRPALECVLPEQFFATAASGSLALLLGAPKALAILCTAVGKQPFAGLVHADSVASAFGFCLTMCCSYEMTLYGLRFAPEEDDKPLHRVNSYGSVKSSDNLGAALLPSEATDGGVRRKTHLAPHHPSYSFASDFYLPRCLALALTLIVCVAATGLKARLHNAGFYRYFEHCLISDLALALLTLYWCTTVLAAAAGSSSALRGARYMGSRFRQMCLRLLGNQLLAASVLATVLGLSVWTEYWACVQTQGSSAVRTKTTMWSLALRGISPFTVSTARAAGLKMNMLVAGLVLMQCYMLLPSREAYIDGVDFEGTSHIFVAVLKHSKLAEKASRRSSLAQPRPKAARQVFCLEQSCFLLECSWQTYYLAPPSSTSVGMDLSRLGLSLLSEFSESGSSIAGYVASGEGTVVVAFRGSVDSRNISSSLNFAQVSLPSMVIEKASILQALTSCGLGSWANEAVSDQYVSPARTEAAEREVRLEDADQSQYTLARLVACLPLLQQV